MDELVILEKVKFVVAHILQVDSSEVTVNTKITEDVKPDYYKPMNRFSLSGTGVGYYYSMSDEYLNKVEIIMGLEEEFNIEIPDEEADNIITVQDAVDYISQKLTV